MKKYIVLFLLPIFFACSDDSNDSSSFEPDYAIMDEISGDWRTGQSSGCRLILYGYEQDLPDQLGTGVHYNGTYQADIEWLADDSEIHITIINENFDYENLQCPAVFTEIMSYTYDVVDGTGALSLTTSENETMDFYRG
tara:strand:+ start:279 stop:695 length:417 start_codon:yes stop_codon:yes gene_type:complete